MTTRQICTLKEWSMAERRLSFDDVNVGDTAPSREHTLTRTDLVVYAGASGDFNPMHHDEVQATQAGMPSVFGHGMFSAGLLATALTDYVGIGNLRRYQVRFAKQTWPGDQLTTRITVTDKRKDDGEQLIDLECALLSGSGEAVVTGEATAALPAGD
jgi:acyl dehydratase